MCITKQPWSECGLPVTIVWAPVSPAKWSDKLSELCETFYQEICSSSGWYQAFPSLHMRFWRKFQFLGDHCFNSLRAKGEQVSLLNHLHFQGSYS